MRSCPKVKFTDDKSYINIIKGEDKNTWSKAALKKTIEVVEELQYNGYKLRDTPLQRTKRRRNHSKWIHGL